MGCASQSYRPSPATSLSDEATTNQPKNERQLLTGYQSITDNNSLVGCGTYNREVVSSTSDRVAIKSLLLER